MNMNEVENGTSSVAARHVPLFASSWVALFTFLRSSLAGENRAGTESPRQVTEDAEERAEH